MGGCQNDGPLLGPLNTRCRMIFRIQKGTIILTITHAIQAMFADSSPAHPFTHEAEIPDSLPPIGRTDSKEHEITSLQGATWEFP